MKYSDLVRMANQAGFTLGTTIVPEKYYTLTNIATKKRYKLKVSTKTLIQILIKEKQIRKVY